MQAPRGKSRNEGRPFQGIDTICVRNTRYEIVICRNEGRPFQGIDTYNGFVVCLQVPFVEMKAAPFRALTQYVYGIHATKS